ncbi:MAG TPA: S46 family peptidase, partial [Pirellulales bacterium]|nr:S46 family peptidase [Pirellulales bacterium]
MKRVLVVLAWVAMMNGSNLQRARGDEGMWLFNRPPRELLAKRYGFEITDAWLKHIQRSSVRFNSGGSGSFVSRHGLVMTNHHVGADSLAKMSTSDSDLVKTGYYARKPADELKCVDLELNVLVDIEDVTERVNAAVKGDAEAAEAQKARQAVMNTIEKESLDKTGLRSDVVTLYQGGMYHLYRYKKYTDVRLVFAPEKAIAFFGGDADNFEYPRYDLDVCLFRVYEDGQPLDREDFLRWSTRGLSDEELIFVSGHPGKTDRQNTYAHLCFLRDLAFPLSMDNIRRREINLLGYSEDSLENARRGEDELFAYQNTRKARLGGLEGLQNPLVMRPKLQAEQELRKRVAADAKLRSADGDAWDQVSAALELWRGIYDQHYLVERGMAFNSELFNIARTLVRLAEESEKPNSERLHEYAAAGLDSL